MNEEIHVNIKHGKKRVDTAVINESLKSLNIADVIIAYISSDFNFSEHIIINWNVLLSGTS